MLKLFILLLKNYLRKLNNLHFIMLYKYLYLTVYYQKKIFIGYENFINHDNKELLNLHIKNLY